MLLVDADELVPRNVHDKLRYLADYDIFDVVWVPSANDLFGHLMKGSGRGCDEDISSAFCTPCTTWPAH